MTKGERNSFSIQIKNALVNTTLYQNSLLSNHSKEHSVMVFTCTVKGKIRHISMLIILSYTDRNLAKKHLNSVPTHKFPLLYHSALKSTDSLLFHLQ